MYAVIVLKHILLFFSSTHGGAATSGLGTWSKCNQKNEAAGSNVIAI